MSRAKHSGTDVLPAVEADLLTPIAIAQYQCGYGFRFIEMYYYNPQTARNSRKNQNLTGIDIRPCTETFV